MTSTARSFVVRATRSLAACVLLPVTLSLWSGLHARTCLALGLPALCCLAASYGIFTHRLTRKRFVLEYWLDPGSSLHAWFTRHWMTAVASLVLGVSLTGFLAVFTALARPTDWYFLCAIAIVTPLVFTAARVWPGRHFRQTGGGRHATLADILSARLSGWVVLGVAVAGYTYANYYLPGPGEYIFPGSLERTLDAFAAQAGSVCPVVDDTLRIAAVIEGLWWYAATTGALLPDMSRELTRLVWTAFFLNTAVVFVGFVRGLEGALLLACRTVSHQSGTGQRP